MRVFAYRSSQGFMPLVGCCITIVHDGSVPFKKLGHDWDTIGTRVFLA